MNRIKNWLINRLGGYTQEQMDEQHETCVTLGRVSSTLAVLTKADELYVESAEEWCGEMYDYLEKRYKTLTGEEWGK